MPRFYRLTGAMLALCVLFSACAKAPEQSITSSTAVISPLENEEIVLHENPRKDWFKDFLAGELVPAISFEAEEENPGMDLP